MDITQEVLKLIDQVLCLNGGAAAFSDQTPLLGAIPELDSMAVVALIGALEERFGFLVDDGEMAGATFATVGSLSCFVREKVGA